MTAGRLGGRVLRRFAGATRAATVLEFAVAAPFLLLLFLMIIENGLMLMGQIALDNATRFAARQIMIGNVTTSSQFSNALCGAMSSLLNCTAAGVNVVSGSAFPTSIATPTSSGTFTNASFSPGSGGSFVVVEVAYDRTYVTSFLGNLVPGWVLLSTVAFQNEPFT